MARHHHQLAQDFLVNQIQNINPNLNVGTSPGSGGLNPLAFFSGLGVPPRGGSAGAGLPSLPFGTGRGGNPVDNTAAAYSNAFLSSLVSQGRGPQIPSQHGPPPVGVWPFISNGDTRTNPQPPPPRRNDTRTPSSMSSSTRDSPPPPIATSAGGAPQVPGAGDTWFEMFMTANSGAGMPGSLHPIAPGNLHSEPHHLDSRSSTPIDGAPLKRPRDDSTSGTGEFSMAVDSDAESGSLEGEEGKKKRKM